jgi:hypothetical protein
MLPGFLLPAHRVSFLIDFRLVGLARFFCSNHSWRDQDISQAMTSSSCNICKQRQSLRGGLCEPEHPLLYRSSGGLLSDQG